MPGILSDDTDDQKSYDLSQIDEDVSDQVSNSNAKVDTAQQAKDAQGDNIRVEEHKEPLIIDTQVTLKGQVAPTALQHEQQTLQSVPPSNNNSAVFDQ